MPVQRLAIVGTGLIGASIGLAAKRAGVGDVAGWDDDPDVLSLARERGALDRSGGSLAEVASGAELVVVATPVAALPAAVRSALGAAPGEATVTDVGSTKAAICAAAADRRRFIGGHPVAGAETRGPGSAREDLFDGATWFLTPVAETEPARYRTLHGFVAALGAVPAAVDPDAHDRLLAQTSHLPHALANVLLNQVGETRIDGREAITAGGGSLRDMTRVAGANPRIWVDIFLDNRQPLLAALGEHRRRVEELERALDRADAGYLARWIGDAALNRRRLLEQAYPHAGELHRVRVRIPDRPGVISGITQALSAERINIESLELDHVSVEHGGTIDLLIGGAEQASSAAALLEAQGYAVAVIPEFSEGTA